MEMGKKKKNNLELLQQAPWASTLGTNPEASSLQRPNKQIQVELIHLPVWFSSSVWDSLETRTYWISLWTMLYRLEGSQAE